MMLTLRRLSLIERPVLVRKSHSQSIDNKTYKKTMKMKMCILPDGECKFTTPDFEYLDVDLIHKALEHPKIKICTSPSYLPGIDHAWIASKGSLNVHIEFIEKKIIITLDE